MNAGINVEIIHFLANPDYEIHFLVPPPRETLRHFVMSSAAGSSSILPADPGRPGSRQTGTTAQMSRQSERGCQCEDFIL